MNNKDFEIIVPILYNTYEKPKNVNNYSVWIARGNDNKPEIFIDNKWFTFVTVVQDNLKEEVERPNLSDKEYAIIKALKEYIKEETDL